MKIIYEYIKRNKAALFCILTLTICLSLKVSADSTAVNYFIRAENFIPNSANSGWTIKNDTGNAEIPTYYNTQNDKDSTISSEIYFEEDGQYIIWAYVKGYPLDLPEKRIFTMDVGGFCDYSPIYGSMHPDTWYWQVGNITNINKGWNKIIIKPLGADVSIGAVYITNDMTKDIKTIQNYSEIKLYEDLTEPIFENNSLIISSSKQNTLDLQWPSAIDNETGLAGYKCEINGDTYAIYDKDTLSASIADLWDLDTVNVNIKAVDMYGTNATISVLDKVVSPFEDVRLEIADINNNKVSSIENICSGNKVRALVNLTNSSEEGETVSLGIGVYNSTTGKMIDNKRRIITVESKGAIINEFVEITLPNSFDPANCILKASLWDDGESPTPVWESAVLKNYLGW